MCPAYCIGFRTLWQDAASLGLKPYPYVCLSVSLPLLLQDIIKRTSEDHPDYKNLKQAQDTMVLLLYIHVHIYSVHLLLYSGKLSKEKTFTNFVIFQPSVKSFLQACHTHYATSFNIP